MTDQQKETYIAWLNDAHALEESLITALERQIHETEERPELRDRLQDHLEETRRHEQLVRGCLARHEEEPSGGKDFFGKVASAISSMGMSMSDDAMVKILHSAYAAEQTEIVTYTLLRAAAGELGDIETTTICDEILIDENVMAQWLLEQIPEVVTEHLQGKV